MVDYAYFMIGFAGPAAAGFVTNPNVQAGDVLVNVFAVTNVATYPGDNIGAFGPGVASTGLGFYSANGWSAGTYFVALVKRVVS